MLEKLNRHLYEMCGENPLLYGVLAIITGILLLSFLPAVMMYVGMGMLVTGLCMHIYRASNEETNWLDIEADPKTLMLIGIVLLIVGALVNWLL